MLSTSENLTSMNLIHFICYAGQNILHKLLLRKTAVLHTGGSYFGKADSSNEPVEAAGKVFLKIA